MRVDSESGASLVIEPDPLPNGFTLHDWAALPLETRVSCLLFDALAALAGITLDLNTDEGTALRWLEPHLRVLSGNVEKALERLVS
ncbi:MAG TPA: hypothetical protein VGQ46_20250 [Thermoanaerobaculia bacterium]|jgi:hypothetical protein|nr:hypothetical protein [Thermoanaerobaculia bacterium]